VISGNIVDSGPLSIITGANGNISLSPNGTGIVTASTAVTATGNITGNFFIGNASQLTGMGQNFRFTAANSLAYFVNGSYPNTTITLTRGQTYYFDVAAPSHPLWIKTDPVIGTGNAYSTGVVNNGAGNGRVSFQVPFTAPGTLYYQCQFHVGMYGTLSVVDGSVIQNGNSNVQVSNNGNITLSATSSYSWNFDTAGNLSLPGNSFAVNYANGTPVSLNNPNTGTMTSGATITPAASNTQYYVTALAESATVAVPSGTPTNGAQLTICIIDNGSAQTLAWNAIYQEIGTTLPTTTVANKYVYVYCIYNAQSSKWHVTLVAQQT
jgi:hypothetical protein